jgi:hypothetical protein
LLRGRFGGQLGFEAFGLAGKRTPSHFAQYGIFAGEIAEKRGLANFQSLNNVVDACVLVAALAKKMQSRFHDLLAKARFLAFAKAGHWPLAGRLIAAPFLLSFTVVDAP